VKTPEDALKRDVWLNNLRFASGIHTASGQLSAFGAVGYVAVIAISVPDINRLPAGQSRIHPATGPQCLHAGFVFT
jgi:hypothetical protein